MRPFAEIFDIAAERKGGNAALEALLSKPATAKQLADVPNDRYLAQAAQCIFNAGFNWKVVEAKWPGFEEAFHQFDLGRIAMFTDDDLNELLTDKRVVRHGTKIRSVQENAQFMIEIVREHGNVGNWIGGWPSDDYIGLLEQLKKRGSRLGGNTGQYFLRFMNKDGFLLSVDVVARLMAENVVEKQPGSKSSMKAVQLAFNVWSEESGRSLKEISRVLAMSVG